MRVLLWKEWRQHWLLFVIGLCLAFPLPVGYALFGVKSSDVTFMNWQYAIVCVYALLVGSNLVASEIHTNTVQQLFALPYEPLKMWLSKYIYGLSTTAAVLVCAALVGILCAGKTGDGGTGFLRTYDAGESLILPILLLRAVSFFSISSVLSTLVRRPIEAVVGAPIFYWIWNNVWIAILTRFGFEDPGYPIPFHLLFITACTCSSALIFTKGNIHTESPDRKMFLLLLSVLGVLIMMVIAAFLMKVLI